MDTNGGFEVLQWVWGKERSLVEKEDGERLRSLDKGVSLTPLEFDSNHFLEQGVGVNDERVYFKKENWKLRIRHF